MKDIIIACAGSIGLEAYVEIMNINHVCEMRGNEKPFRFLGFLSDVPVDLESKGIHEKVLGTIADWIPGDNEYFYVGLTKPEQKKKIADLLQSKGGKFANIISPYAQVASDIKMGQGCLITGGSTVSFGVTMGDFVSIHGSLLYAGARIGDYSTTVGFTVIENAEIGEGVFVGSKAVVMENCSVGSWSQVYVGSVVMNDIPSHTAVFGMPAKEI